MSEPILPPPSNDSAILVARTDFDRPVLELDFPSLHIGIGEYEEGPTGCTVLYFPDGAMCETDVRGGSPGVIASIRCNAVCLTGGSIYGLEAATGIASELLARNEYSTEWDRIQIVNTAVIFDFRVRDTAIYPDKELGRAAIRAAAPGRFPLGQRGAGRSATVGKAFALTQREPGGQGGAFRQVGPVKVAVFTVLNSIGAIVDRQGRIVRGYLAADGDRRLSVGDALEQALGEDLGEPPGGNTTITAVVTNQVMDAWSLRQFGRQVHASMARGIQPFHGRTDGDVLFAVTTNEVEETINPTHLGVLASELAWDAILSAVEI